MASARKPGRQTAPTPLVDRYLALVDHLARETGKPRRGWQARVARRLGVHATTINKIATGKRASVGMDVIEAAIATVPIPREYFFAPADVERDPASYVKIGALSTKDPSRADGVLRDVRHLEFAGKALSLMVAADQAPSTEERARRYRALADLVIAELPEIVLARAVKDSPTEVAIDFGRQLASRIAKSSADFFLTVLQSDIAAFEASRTERG